jgi:hypothetical protein
MPPARRALGGARAACVAGAEAVAPDPAASARTIVCCGRAWCSYRPVIGGEHLTPNGGATARVWARAQRCMPGTLLGSGIGCSGCCWSACTQRVPRLDVITRARGPIGRGRRRPARVIADRGSDHNTHRRLLCGRGIASAIACRDTGQRCGLDRECAVRVCALGHLLTTCQLRVCSGCSPITRAPRSAWPAACRAPAAGGAHPVRAP